MKIFFTSDTHFGHSNIIEYCNRPFKNIEHMNKELIKRFNERVKPEDSVFFLGDFCFKSGTNRGEGLPNKADYYRQQLNCKNITFIMGNHDNNNSLKTIIESLVIRYGGKWIKLVHSPDTQYIETKYDLMFVGHVHQNWKFKRIKQGFGFVDLINVGVDVWNFYPVTFSEIIKQYSRWIKGKEKDDSIS